MVRFLCTPSDSFEDPRVEVYNFKADCWKEFVVVDKKFHGFFGLPLSSVCLRGTPYWLGYNKYFNGTVSIQCFDFSKERFEYLVKFLRESSIGSVKWEDYLSLGIFKEDHLSLLHGSHLTGRIQIWVMNLNKEWSKLMAVNVMPQVTRFPKYSSHFIKNNGTLMLSIRHYKTGSNIYIVGENQECQEGKYCSSIDLSIGGCYYVPSLLRVPGFRGEKKNK